MNLHIKQLIKLSKLDKEIDLFEPQIVEITSLHNSVVSKIETIKLNIQNIESLIEVEKQNHAKNEIHLLELAQKLKENSKKTGDIKTEREMKSLQLEEEITKEQVTFANEEIARLDKIIESKTELIDEEETKLEELVSTSSSIKEDVDTKVEVINKKREKVSIQAEKLKEKINSKALTFYNKIRHWAKNSAIVLVEDQACMGCHMLVNDKVYADVIKAEEIVTCSHCGRILYIETT